MEYAVAEWRDKYRIASENPAKDDVVAGLLERYRDSRVLIIGQYLKQLRRIARALRHAADHRRRRRTPSARTCTTSSARGEVRQLILSKVGNFAIDLPDANVLIQVSGTFGSRQEEAQRLGRILRPKAGGEVGPLLHAGDARHARAGLRPPPPAVPDRAGLQLRDRGRSRLADRRPTCGLALAGSGETYLTSSGDRNRRWTRPASP